MIELAQIAWWFAAEQKLPNGDGREVTIGETHTVDGPLELCRRGLHWSIEPFDALEYAPGTLLFKVRPGGDFLLNKTKGCSAARTYIAVRNVEDMLRSFARDEALRVIHLWAAPGIVRRYLETGDVTIRAAAGRAAASAVTPAASDAAWAAASDAAWAAAGDAAWAAAGAAASDAAWAAAWDASRERFNAAVYALFEERQS